MSLMLSMSDEKKQQPSTGQLDTKSLLAAECFDAVRNDDKGKFVRCLSDLVSICMMEHEQGD